MNKRSVWQEEYRVRTYEVSADGSLNLTTLCNFMQECASNHAQHLGFGKEYLEKTKRMWALARLHLHVDRLPVVGSTIVVQTWPRGASGVFAFRDFMFYDVAGNGIAEATSSWLLLDIGSKRPGRPDRLLAGMHLETDRRALDSSLQKLSAPETPEILHRYTVRVSDIDVRNHVNNARYVEWLENAFRQIDDVTGALKSFEINFLAEAFVDDTVEILYEREPSSNSRLAANSF